MLGPSPGGQGRWEHIMGDGLTLKTGACMLMQRLILSTCLPWSCRSWLTSCRMTKIHTHLQGVSSACGTHGMSTLPFKQEVDHFRIREAKRDVNSSVRLRHLGPHTLRLVAPQEGHSWRGRPLPCWNGCAHAALRRDMRHSAGRYVDPGDVDLTKLLAHPSEPPLLRPAPTRSTPLGPRGHAICSDSDVRHLCGPTSA